MLWSFLVTSAAISASDATPDGLNALAVFFMVICGITILLMLGGLYYLKRTKRTTPKP